MNVSRTVLLIRLLFCGLCTAIWNVNSSARAQIVTTPKPDVVQTPAPILAKPEAKPKPTISVYHLKHAMAKEVELILRDIYRINGEKINLGKHPSGNSLILYASSAKHAEFSGLLKSIDVPKHIKSNQPVSHRVQLFWLVNELEDDTPPPSEMLAPALKELSNLGIENLRQVSHVIVNSNPEGNFHVQCSPEVDGKQVTLQFEGQLSRQGDVPNAKIRVSAAATERIKTGEQQTGNRKLQGLPPLESYKLIERNLVTLSTEITAPRGHFVVLGATPIGKKTSVFVLQILK